MRTIQTLLCPVDLTPISRRELELAAQLAERFDADLVVQHDIVETGERPDEWIDASMRGCEGARAAMVELLSELPAPVAPRARGVVTHGPPVARTVDVTRRLPAELVVVGTHGRSRDHQSMTDGLLESSPAPVLTTHDEAPQLWLPRFDSDDRIRTLVPTDFASHSEHALRYALDLRARLPLDVEVLYVSERPDRGIVWARERLAEIVGSERSDGVELRVEEGAALKTILGEETYRASHLVVMAAHHRGWIERMLSGRRSTVQEMVRRSLCPVWVVPAAADG